MADRAPMTRRVIFLPDSTWEALQQYAIKLTVKEKAPVSASEAARRILARSLAGSLRRDDGETK